MINQFSFQQLNTEPSNVKGNMLDLVFINAPELFSSINEYLVDISSHHKVLILVFHCRIFRQINVIFERYLITKLQVRTILDRLWNRLIYVR